MARFKVPVFTERAAAAAAARKQALEPRRNKPAPDPELVARRQAAQVARDAAAAERRAARQAAADQAAADKAAARAAAAAKAERPVPSEAELKAERDARYAARKARKR